MSPPFTPISHSLPQCDLDCTMKLHEESPQPPHSLGTFTPLTLLWEYFLSEPNYYYQELKLYGEVTGSVLLNNPNWAQPQRDQPRCQWLKKSPGDSSPSSVGNPQSFEASKLRPPGIIGLCSRWPFTHRNMSTAKCLLFRTSKFGWFLCSNR